MCMSRWARVLFVVFVHVPRDTHDCIAGVQKESTYVFRRCRRVSVFRLCARASFSQFSHAILQRSGPRSQPAISQRGLGICSVQENTSNIVHPFLLVVLLVPDCVWNRAVRDTDIGGGARNDDRCATDGRRHP